MLEKLTFYLKHSVNDLRVNGQRTFFALLCIAAGVAAIVSLQTLAVMAGDALVGAVQETNRADIRLLPTKTVVTERGRSTTMVAVSQTNGILVDKSDTFMGISIPTRAFSEDGLKQMRTWIENRFPGQLDDMTYRQFVTGFTGVTVNAPEQGNQASFVSPIVIEAEKYPLYGKVAVEGGKPLRDVLRSSNDIVISRGLANKLDAKVGDTVRLDKSSADFTVQAIAPDEAEGGLENLAAGLFGFVYLDMSAVPLLSDPVPAADIIYWRLKDPTQVGVINDALVRNYDFLGTQSTDELREQNQQTAIALNQLVTVMGLISLLIGGIGIVNTMQVVVRRRTLEVAVLKTIGLEANQITILFLVEAFLMGLIGSLAGILLGWLMTFAIKGVAETFLSQPLAFRPAPGPALNGLLVGTLVTTIFGFLPTLSAGQVRPGVVLRPNETVVPRAGCLRSIAALLVVIVALSLIAQPIVGSLTLAIEIMAGTFVAAGILYVLLWALIWLVGHIFPTFRFVDLKIALRSMLAARRRGATTLLALVIGVFSLSLITLFAAAVNNLFDSLLVQQSGGNVFIFAGGAGVLPRIEETLKKTEGIKNYNLNAIYNARLVSVEKPDGKSETIDQIRSRLIQKGKTSQDAGRFQGYLGNISAFRVDLKLPEKRILNGRMLNAGDAGKPVIVIPTNELIRAVGLDVGDKLTYELPPGGALGAVSFGSSPKATFQVVGTFERANVTFSTGTDPNSAFAPLNAFPAAVSPTTVQAVVDIEESHIGALQREMGKIPGTFVLEAKFINRVLSTLIGQFTSFPILVAALGLLVGGIVIANSVALTTMERRREIAIMKAIGLQRERVLGMLLLENALMGFIGGLLGVGIGLLGLIIMQASLVAQAGGIQINFVPYGTAFLLMLLCIGVALIAALASAWGASGEKPLTVLRYE